MNQREIPVARAGVSVLATGSRLQAPTNRKDTAMSLTMWNKNPMMDEFARTREEMDRLLGRFLTATPLSAFDTRSTRLEGWIPAIDVSETDDGVVIRAEVPGIAARDLEITVTGNILNISGKKEEKEEVDQEDFYRCERRFGSFRRVIDLPESIDPDRVTADVDNGIVTIRVAKKPGLRSRRVEVKPTSRRVPVPG
jgi:HSP20 family protein